MGKLRLLSLMAVVAGMVLGIGALALGSGGAQAEAPSIQGTMDGVVTAWNNEDLDTFVTYFTEAGLMHNFDYHTGDDAVAVVTSDRADSGPISSAKVTDIKIMSLTEATGIVDLQFEQGFSLYEEWDFHLQDGMWKIGDGRVVSRPIPPGVAAVDLSLREYAFDFNAAAIQAADGNVAFHVMNDGTQAHEVLLLKLDTNDKLSDVVNSILQYEGEDLPPGLEFVAFGGEYQPGEQGNFVLSGPLAPGRYAFICFLPNAEGVPHVALGMSADFTVGSAVSGSGNAGGITPPNTGDAGLLDQGHGTSSWLMLGVALMLVLGATVGVARSRGRSDA